MPFPKEQSYTVEDIYNLPDGQRAELIDGVMYDMAPPSYIHQKISAKLTSIIDHYISDQHGSCEVLPAPFAVFLSKDDKTYVEPDISVICDKNKLSDRGCEGAPDWIIEIVSPSSQKMDYLIKLWKYRAAGVREYWIVNPANNITQAYFFEGAADFAQYSFSDTMKVGIYDGLEICIADLLK